MAKKGSGKRDKDAGFDEILNQIEDQWASFDGPLPHVDWSANNDKFALDWSAVDKMFAHLDDWSTVDAMLPAQEPRASLDDLFPHIDWSADNDKFALDWSAVDDVLAHLNDWSTLDAMFPVDLTFDKLDGLLQPIDNAMGKSRPRRKGRKTPR